MEPIKKLFLTASRAKLEFLMGDENKKHEILKNLLWNLSLKNKNIVSVQYKKQFDMIAKSPKKGISCALLRELDSVRTAFMAMMDYDHFAIVRTW